MPSTKRRPSFRELDRAECDEILGRNQLGRIAFSFHDHVDIAPLHYVRQGEWLYARTSVGAKLMTMAHHRWVAFEVDEVDALFDWRSVVVRGAVYLLDPDGAPLERRAYAEGLEVLKSVIPETFAAQDPVPFRNLVIRIHVDEVSGRASSTTGG